MRKGESALCLWIKRVGGLNEGEASGPQARSNAFGAEEVRLPTIKENAEGKSEKEKNIGGGALLRSLQTGCGLLRRRGGFKI